MIRIQKEVNHSFSDRTDLGVVNLKFPKVSFTVSGRNGNCVITTDSMTLIYNAGLDITKGGIKLSYRGFRLDRLDEKDSMNLGGVIGSLDNCKGNMHYHEQNDVGSACEPHPVPDGILSRRGFTILRHTPDTLYLYRSGESFNELYLLGYGNDYKRAFSDFYSLAGKIPLLPEWSLGFIYSRWKDYNENDYRTIVARFRKEKIPLDAIILDMCWHIDYWYGFRYDTTRFRDMREFHRWTDTMHLKTGFNHHAGAIYYKDPQVHEFCARAGINYDSALTAGLPWEPQEKIIRFNPANQNHFKTFYEMYLARLMKDGLDFHWVDGESSIYSADLYQKYTTGFTGKRGVVMNRLQNNVLCNHRYPFGFSGDTFISWETMAYSLEVNIKGGNNGVYWSHDIGGYMPQGPAGYPPGAEMFARWLQLGAVSPIFRVHAKKDIFWTPPYTAGGFDQGSRLPWEWGDTVLNSARISIQLRYKLLPYIYTMTRIAHDRGLPLVRGLYIDYPLAAGSYRYDEYLFGNEMLAAPIMEPSAGNNFGEILKKVWLPEGEWYDYFTHQKYCGNRDVTVAKSIFEFPLFVKAGSIVPLASYMDYSGAPLDTLIIMAFTPSESKQTAFGLYEDDGETFPAKTRQFRWINLRYEYSKDRYCKFIIDKPKGSYRQNKDKRTYLLKIINTSEPKLVRLDGKKIEHTGNGNVWMWEPIKREIVVIINRRNINKSTVVEAEL